MVTTHLLIGGNKGNVPETFRQAIEMIEARIGRLKKFSSLYKTAAWGNTNQPDFLNKVLVVETVLPPHDVMQQCLDIESKLGRVRKEKYGPRTIDIDILFYGNEIIQSRDLTIPHPQLQFRRFVLVPLNEISYHKKHPVLHKTIHQLLTNCEDKLDVKKICL